MNSRLLAIVSLVLVMTVWGGSFAVTKAAVDDLPPIFLAFLRFAVASAVLLPLAWPRRRAHPIPLRAALVLGLTGVGLYYVCFNLGLVYTTVTQAVLIQSAIPALTAGLAFFLLAERLPARVVCGIALSFVGVAVVLVVNPADARAPRPLLGNALIVGSAVLWSLYTIYAKRLAQTDTMVLTAWTAAAGTALLAPAALVEYALGARPTLTVSGGLSVLYLGVISSAAAYLLYNRALRSLGASQVTAFLNLMPIVGVATAVVFLRERIVPAAILGGVLVLAGVWLASGKARDPDVTRDP